MVKRTCDGQYCCEIEVKLYTQRFDTRPVNALITIPDMSKYRGTKEANKTEAITPVNK